MFFSTDTVIYFTFILCNFQPFSFFIPWSADRQKSEYMERDGDIKQVFGGLQSGTISVFDVIIIW